MDLCEISSHQQTKLTTAVGTTEPIGMDRLMAVYQVQSFDETH